MQREALPQDCTSPPSAFQNPHLHVGDGRLFHDDELVTAHALLAVGDGARLVVADRQRLAARIDHDKVVAKTVHFAERNGRGGNRV
ncbi:hypothetical protein [Aestuariivirga sp.]|uniref:hypothetical protein n=1 Tax=Aestuariivirga sp. TaxID=2650926 RepID=UPI0039E65D75